MSLSERKKAYAIYKFGVQTGIIAPNPAGTPWNSQSYFEINKDKIFDFYRTINYREEAQYYIGINKFDNVNRVKRFFREAARRKGYRGRTNYKRMGVLFEAPRSVDFIRGLRRERTPFLQELVLKQKRRSVNKLLAKQKFQKILNMVVNGDITLTRQQAITFLNFFKNSSDKYRLKVKINNKEHIIYINETSSEITKDILTKGYIENEQQEYGSDYFNQIDIQNIQSIKIEKLPPPSRIIKNKDGRFFPYINKTELDLNQYQIYQRASDFGNGALGGNAYYHCFIYSLMMNGVPSELVERVATTFVKGAAFKKSDINYISKLIDITIVLHQMKPNGEVGKTFYNKGKDIEANIAIYEEHYFAFEKTINSKFFINNYERCKEYENPHDIIRFKHGKPVYGEGAKINSLLMVDKLFKAGYFVREDMTQTAEAGTHKILKNHIYIDPINDHYFCQEQIDYKKHFDERELSKAEYVPRVILPTKTFYCDSETFVSGDKHELFLLGSVGEDTDDVIILNATDERFKYSENYSPRQKLVYKWLDYITNDSTNNAVVYFHNLKYDYAVLEEFLNVEKFVKKDNILYSVEVIHKQSTITLIDSFKFWAYSLAKLATEYELEEKYRKKEAINYVYYTEENSRKRATTEEYKENLTFAEREIFDNEMKTNGNKYFYDEEKGTFDPVAYYKEYLKMDCLVLKKGLQKYNESVKEITKDILSIDGILTISSLVDRYMTLSGVYDGIYSISGNLRQYVSQAVCGGRVLVNPKYAKKIIDTPTADFDGNSLYPSAMVRLCEEMGLPIGPAKKYSNQVYQISAKLPDDLLGVISSFCDRPDISTWKSKCYSILTVRITKVKKHQQMPFIYYKNKNGILEYTNNPPRDPVRIDSITLEDYINFHDIEYELIDGIYWDEGYNKKMGEVVNGLINDRAKAKKEKKNAKEQTIKLMANSVYGKTVIKQTFTKYTVKRKTTRRLNKKSGELIEKDNINPYIWNNFRTIKTTRDMSQMCMEFEEISIDKSNNRAHIGCAILSMSKRIMNEVFDIANDLGCPIYYTDTDSIHLPRDDVPKIEAEFKKRYGRELTGDGLGKFNIDFKLKGAADEIYAEKSIFLGKKSYLDCLVSKDKDGNTIRGFHYRLKGITEDGLIEKAKEYSDGMLGLYTDLADGKELTFILNPFNKETNKQKVLFDFMDNGVRTKKQFIRKVKF